MSTVADDDATCSTSIIMRRKAGLPPTIAPWAGGRPALLQHFVPLDQLAALRALSISFSSCSRRNAW